jgi:transglutaminase-like putative cysteine protease
MTAFHITHTTKYTYTRAIFLEPHMLRLRPRCDAAQNLLQFAFELRPRPHGVTQSTDLDGNVALCAWFEGPTESFTIQVNSQVVALRRNPFDYIITDRGGDRLPLSYSESLKNSIVPYLSRPARSQLIEQFANSIAEQTEWKTIRFLTALNREIHESCRQIVREEGDPRPPEETFSRKEGSCRDLAVLFMDACRSVGIAARFISGYEGGDPLHGIRRLHAWAEIYLPGPGWRGYDPTRGLAVADRHVAIAAAATPQMAAPVTGSFRGDGAQSSLTAEIDMREVEESSVVMQQTQQQ